MPDFVSFCMPLLNPKATSQALVGFLSYWMHLPERRPRDLEARKHVTWSTRSFVDACRRAKDEGLVVGIAHSHPSGYSTFSEQDDQNERDLVGLARNRNGQSEILPSILLVGKTVFAGRVWLDETGPVKAASMQVVGCSFQFLDTSSEFQDDAFARQALAFGPAVNVILRRLKVGIVGCGGTGSAVAMLLGRLGVGQIALFDEDIVEVTNLNRLHGATRADADASGELMLRGKMSRRKVLMQRFWASARVGSRSAAATDGRVNTHLLKLSFTQILNP